MNALPLLSVKASAHTSADAPASTSHSFKATNVARSSSAAITLLGFFCLQYSQGALISVTFNENHLQSLLLELSSSQPPIQAACSVALASVQILTMREAEPWGRLTTSMRPPVLSLCAIQPKMNRTAQGMVISPLFDWIADDHAYKGPRSGFSQGSARAEKPSLPSPAANSL